MQRLHETQKMNKGNVTSTDLMDKLWQEGLSAKEAIGLNDAALVKIYNQAHQLYSTGKHAEAIHLFRFLITFDPMNPKYMLGLAASLHMLKEYFEAADIYMTCTMLDPKNPIPPYHASDCYIQMNDPIPAMFNLELAIACCGDNSNYATLKEKAQLSLDSLNQRIQS